MQLIFAVNKVLSDRLRSPFGNCRAVVKVKRPLGGRKPSLMVFALAIRITVFLLSGGSFARLLGGLGGLRRRGFVADALA